MYCAENCSCTLCRELCCVKRTRTSEKMATKNRPPVTVPKPKFIQMIRTTSKCTVTDDEKDKQKINLILERRSSECFDKQNRKSSVTVASRCVQNHVECDDRQSVAPLTKSMSCNEIRKQFESRSVSVMAAANNERRPATKVANGNHKTVIYFGDSISSKKQISWPVQHHRISSVTVARNKIVSDVQHAKRLCDEMVFKRQQSIRLPAMPPPMKIELRSLKVAAAVTNAERANSCSTSSNNVSKRFKESTEANVPNESINTQNLPKFVESVTNGVINIKIEGSYDVAAKLVQSIENDNGEVDGELNTLNENVRRSRSEINGAYYDWSFVQDWRSR